MTKTTPKAAVKAVTPKIRAAVYVRKSNEAGLEQEFNSLHAQTEACLSFIASQKTEGWVAVPDHYEDGGISGGTLDRPGLQRLLADIVAGRIDVVVVYKIDRLTRSLLDFVKLIEVFEQHKVTFTSVTQSFSTQSSMGRLTLNILLSFAQFERELASERIRDKFAASKRRGLWMGGLPSLGYDVVDRKLVVNAAEADLVRLIFRRFLEIGSATALIRELRAAGHTSKSWVTQDGKARQGKPLNKGALYKILNNRLYVGEISHRGTSYPGAQEAIIDRQTWDRVQTILKQGASPRGRSTGAATPAPLKGLLRCTACGSAMTPTHTRRRGRLYRYYICTTAIKQGHAACPIRSIAAGEAEELVLAQVRRLLRAPELTARTIAAAADASAEAATTTDGGRPAAQRECQIRETLHRVETIWDDLFPAEQQRILHLLVEQVAVSPGGFDITLRTAGIRSLAAELGTDGASAEEKAA
ncbi:MAG: recombinase family protein [Azospirillum sp.]|nr:recombinase family protein [Azospirillum sp.]